MKTISEVQDGPGISAQAMTTCSGRLHDPGRLWSGGRSHCMCMTIYSRPRGCLANALLVLMMLPLSSRAQIRTACTPSRWLDRVWVANAK